MKHHCAIILFILCALIANAAAQSAPLAKNERREERADAPLPAAPDFARERAKMAARAVGGRTRALSLREAVEQALANNPDVALAQKNVRLAEFDLAAARGAFDTRFAAATEYRRERSPLTNSIFASGESSVRTSVFTNSARLEKPLGRFGTVLAGEFSNALEKTDDPFNSFRRSYRPALSLSLVQPLGKGRRIDDGRRRIEIAKRNLTLSDQQFRQRAIEIVAEAQRAYWDLTYALKDLQVQQTAVRDTQQQLAATRRRIDEGAAPPIEAVALENQVAQFEAAAARALENVTRRQNALKNLIARDETAAVWNESILPADDAELEIPDVALGDALAAALANRLELKQNETARAVNEIDRRFYRDRTRPQIDLRAGYAMNGFAGRESAGGFDFADPLLSARVNELSRLAGLPPLPAAPPAGVPANLRGGQGRALTNLFRQDFNTFQIGVTIEIPLENRTARAELGRNLVEAEKLDLERRKLAQAITAEVRNAVETLAALKLRLAATRASRTAVEREFQSEERKYNAGYAGSSLFVLLEKQKTLTAARAAEIEVRLELNKALAEYERVVGALPKDVEIAAR